ncbi:uncharacterized protein LOC119068213 isoform X2 [Bradysia coprophila]|uniref:uncharacterized protein LOC119068213 isoform X2 n=1 Tax=Bradysia coprophila TaxID=38358 RepID=UPI00187DAA92|nr:uncharacterized protein LOC119068213 isoform X2 [Bradysia coprophila]
MDEAQNGNSLGNTGYLDFDSPPESHCNGMDMQSVGNLLPSPDGYPDMELNKYLNFDSNVAANRRDSLESKRGQSLDDFFQDFQEIIASEMKPITSSTITSTSTSYDQERTSTSTNIISYGDPSAAFNSTISGVDFSLDLTQFYINSNEAEFLNADELKTDFSDGLIPFQSSQFTYQDKTVDDNQEFSVIDLSTGNTEIYGKSAETSAGTLDEAVDNNIVEFSATDNFDQPKKLTDYTDTKISVSTPLNQFYLDFKLNGETSGPSDAGNSIVTYISKDALQSVEYINESGQTETVMYVDQQSDEKNGSVTQYEIINFEDYQYQTENGDQQQFTSNSELIPEISSVPHYGDNVDSSPQLDILSTLLSDKSNKIMIISKPLRNPKVRQSCDEFYQKFQEIDANPTNISFAQQPKAKGCRKQKFETITQVDVEVVEPKPCPSNKKISATPAIPDMTTIPETPKLPSRFMRDRRSTSDVKRKRPRRLFWDSESDCENGARPIKKSKKNC